MIVGVLIGFPPVILPLLFPGSDASLPWTSRYTTKANVWIFILSWVANYLWTHYFYTVLGASYTFPAWRLNDVPFALYLITHSYFHFYHVLSNIVLRWFWRRFDNRVGVASALFVVLLIASLSFVVAFMETFTIQHFPYYHIPDRTAMYLYGSMFYALYFVVSFPMFLRMDERPGECWSISRATIDALAACMLITQLLDFWRLWIGPIVDLDEARRLALLVKPAHVDVPPTSKIVPFIN
jgi:cycloeucalenol cycloisomerase